jgi:hypothetical protein
MAQDNQLDVIIRTIPVLPLQSYYGLLSRAPTRLSPDLQRSGEGNAVTETT